MFETRFPHQARFPIKTRFPYRRPAAVPIRASTREKAKPEAIPAKITIKNNSLFIELPRLVTRLE